MEILPPAVRYGIAPAMNADPRRMYWGGDKHVEAGKEVKEFCGCDSKFEMKSWDVKEVLKKIDGEATARELVQHFTTMYDGEDLALPERAKGDMPMEPNVYTDGSMLNPSVYDWQIGGFGVWWKDREAKDRPLSKHERGTPMQKKA